MPEQTTPPDATVCNVAHPLFSRVLDDGVKVYLLIPLFSPKLALEERGNKYG